MAGKPKGLSGTWSGVYRYGGIPVHCPFNAWLTEDGSHLSGDIIEPNTFRDHAADEVMAGLVGRRVGQEVVFTKTYTDIEVEKVLYEGQVDTGFKRVAGTWRIDETHMSGSFVMHRDLLTKTTRARDVEAMS